MKRLRLLPRTFPDKRYLADEAPIEAYKIPPRPHRRVRVGRAPRGCRNAGGSERDKVLKKIQQAETASAIEALATSPGLKLK